MRRSALTIALLFALIGAASEPPGAWAKPPRAFYGVVPQADLTTADFDRMERGRVAAIRVTLGWSEIDQTPLPGDLDWDEFDFIVANAARRGILVLPTVFTAPTWITSLDGCEGPIGSECGLTAPRSDIGLAAFRSFLGSAVQRYGHAGTFWRTHPELPPRPIVDWQIWNEQNSPAFYRPAPTQRGTRRS